MTTLTELKELLASHQAKPDLNYRRLKFEHAVRDSAPDLIATVEALKELLDAGDNCVNPKDNDDVAAMLRFGTARDQARAALAPFGE